MTKLVSEQLPNDGAYHVPTLVKAANERLDKIGKRGKRAKIVAKKTSLSLQFTFKDGNGNSQKNVGLGAISVSPNGILEAENKAQMVTNQLTANSFTWDWYDKLIGRDTSEQAKQLTCIEMVGQYKKHYFKQREQNKTTIGSWGKECGSIEDISRSLDKPISLSLIREVIESKKNNSSSRKEVLNGLTGFLKYFDNSDYKDVIEKYKDDNKPKTKKRNVPSNNEITKIFNLGFTPKPRSNKRYLYRYPQWQFLYGLLATYGLRIHEVWNIANWDKPVTLKNGDWVTIDVDDETEESTQHSGEDLIVPAILDPNNTQHFLCIKHNTKTGYRVAFPISPNGHNWIEEFNLLQPFNIPDIENPLGKSNKLQTAYLCSISACRWFKRQGYNFTPHDLRHAYNHRGHQSGFNPKALADSLGHSITMNSSTYLRHMSDSVKLQGMMDAIDKDQKTRSKVEELETENKALKHELELLRTKLKMYEAIESNTSSNY